MNPGKLVRSGLVVATAALAGASGVQGARESVPRPNVLWLVLEDTTAEYVAPFGDGLVRTPTAARLAREGVAYNRTYTAPVCSPSRTTLMLGHHASSLGMQNHRSWPALPPDVRFFTEYLREAGYYCANNEKMDYNTSSSWEHAWDENGLEADWVGRKEGQPFFAMFTFMQSHESGLHQRLPLTTDPAKVRVPAFLPDTPEVRADIAQVHDLVTVADRAAGEVLARLEAEGLLEDTIVFYFGDNGSGQAGGKRNLNEQGTHVPFIVRFPKKHEALAPAAPGTRVDDLVNLVDFAPTVLRLAGTRAPRGLQGRVYAGSGRSPAPEYTYMFRDRMDQSYDLMRAVTDGRYRYVRNYHPERPLGQYLEYLWRQATMQDWAGGFARGTLNATQRAFFEPKAPEELYDIVADPDNVRNLAGDPAQRATLERFRKELRRQMIAIGDSGLMPEPMMMRLAGEKSPRVIARRKTDYPLGEIIETIDRLQLGADAEAVRRKAAKHSRPVMRYWAAASALGTAKISLESLRPLLSDAEPVVRITAAEAILQRGVDAPALDVLLAAIRDGSRPELRLFAMNAFMRSGVKVPADLKPLLEEIGATKETAGYGHYCGRVARAMLARGLLRNAER